ncbi:MAG: hypothetical protein DYG89_32520 [Caldilinea sp. CFX5]|nr:hypothetical protein [Caldilinea sp. CFX5]
MGWANGVPPDSQVIGSITVGDYLGVTINNVGVNYGSDTVIMNAGESFWLSLDYRIFDGVCPSCFEQIIFGFSAGAPAACQEVGTPGVDGQSDFFSFPITAPTQPGEYTIGYDRSQSFSCNDALTHGWWTTPPSGARILAHITVPATPVAYDYGDAPEPDYFTLVSKGGARHALPNGLKLGATVDSEADGQPTADASGDGADEDGVTLPATLTVCAQNEITVNAAAGGVLNAWIDYAGNGDFADYDDQVIAALPISQSVTYTATNGIARTEVISMFTGIETVDYDIVDDAYLNGQEAGFVTNFSDLESGAYHLWVQVDDGKNAPQQMYVIDPVTN